MYKLQVIADKLNIRNSPNADPAFANWVGDMSKGEVFHAVKLVKGSMYDGSDDWYADENNRFITATGTITLPASIDNDLSKKIVLNNPVVKNGRGIIIGILDSGIDTGHPALKASLESEKNFMTDSGENAITNNHGTNIAGLLTGNDEIISGLTIDARLRSFRVIKNSNSIDEFALQKALDDISINDTDTDILNLSFEVIDSSFPFFENTFNKIIQKNIILVVAGNVNNSVELNSLSRLKNVIVVGAFDAIDFDKIPQPINVFFINSAITTTNIFSNTEKHGSFSDSSAYTAIVSGIIGRFLSNKFIPKEKRYKEITDYLNSCLFNKEEEKLPFKLYKNVTH